MASDGLTLINNYFNGFELVVLGIGIAAVVVWIVSMWKRGGQYAGKFGSLGACRNCSFFWSIRASIRLGGGKASGIDLFWKYRICL